MNYITQPTPIELKQWLHHLAPRVRDAHKGDFGHTWLFGGYKGLSGAIRMAAEAALRVGAGRVSVVTHPEHAPTLNATRPELMVHGCAINQTAPSLATLISQASVLVLGPGLGLVPWSHYIFEQVVATELPMVIDADGLNLLAPAPSYATERVLTPHPGEAARLLQTDVPAIQANRLQAAQAIVEQYGGVCVLKGAGTIIAAEQGSWQCQLGNPGMASAGMGDVLSGMIAGFISQGIPVTDAAILGAALHASAADQAALAQGERGLLATDLMPYLQTLVNPHE